MIASRPRKATKAHGATTTLPDVIGRIPHYIRDGHRVIENPQWIEAALALAERMPSNLPPREDLGYRSRADSALRTRTLGGTCDGDDEDNPWLSVRIRAMEDAE